VCVGLFQVNLWELLIFCHVFHYRTFGDKRCRFFTDQMPFMWPNQQCESSKRNWKHWHWSADITHRKTGKIMYHIHTHYRPVGTYALWQQCPTICCRIIKFTALLGDFITHYIYITEAPYNAIMQWQEYDQSVLISPTNPYSFPI